MASDASKPLILSGVGVCFPHQPYGVQKVFMAQVVKAIDHEENALLEAPTGCGKTLSLLCGALAWQSAVKAKKAATEEAAAATALKAVVALGGVGSSQNQPEDGTKSTEDVSCPTEPPVDPVVVPKIYYATRTHSQIAQVCCNVQDSGDRHLPPGKQATLGVLLAQGNWEG